MDVKQHGACVLNLRIRPALQSEIQLGSFVRILYDVFNPEPQLQHFSWLFELFLESLVQLS